ncbi:OB-fold nucleic acid binding domain-containing protein [Cyanobacterium sp. IPPAS B-1200]|uniref:helix-hairpin-helix domain-containing protein n=1 Tax=Cyanobacterium sp. IPPAS B-1200 TaxID=1562720 RepID=UPI000852689C|nr:OB-fold nucleic acid binding domain-containing protein [Cyanobacterium sp. IPPAS B-1200]OEJ77351.1 DNA polymerase III subunit alpha [Cyanobacterium sp. IPPAS B-1200]
MVKIVKRRSHGIQKVYDIGVGKDHNFLLQNGLVASNCFNKSHSTAYAYVTYQTAYLKANYPVEYMSALMSASSDNQEKVEKYRENCLKMGIDVLSPNINFSQKEFTPQGEKIIFGLSAIKNLGENAIDNILEAREEAGGIFEDIGDFMARINLKTVNKRALETLVYAGAFDTIHDNRKQLLEGLELLISWSQKRHQEKESGQLNMLDLLSATPEDNSNQVVYANAPQLPKIEDFTPQEKLKSEKEYLGFYVSEHPLKPFVDSAKILAPINISDLGQQKSRTKICVVAMLTMIKPHIDKNGNTMAFLTAEDISGQVDAIVFASTYNEVKNQLREDTPVIIWGKADKNKKDDKPQMIVDYIEVIEQVKMVLISLNFNQADEPKLQGKLKSILQEQSGEKNKAKIPVFALLHDLQERIFIRLGNNYWVQNAENTVNALKNAGFNAYTQSLNNNSTTEQVINTEQNVI